MTAPGARVAMVILVDHFGPDGPWDPAAWLEALTEMDDVVARRAALRLVDAYDLGDGWPPLHELEQVAAGIERFGRAGQLAQPLDRRSVPRSTRPGRNQR